MTGFDGRSSFGTWLTPIAINSALMILRKKRAALEIATDCDHDFGADGLHEISDHQSNPEKRYAQSEEEIMLKKAIQRLRPTLRVVVQIQQLQERSMREAAEAIGISLSAAKGRLFYTKNAPRRSMTPKPAKQPRFASGFVLCPPHNGWRSANTRTDQQPSTHKEEEMSMSSKTKRNGNTGFPATSTRALPSQSRSAA
jgi:RNA polymerase sigma factor (sigma-70 family)